VTLSAKEYELPLEKNSKLKRKIKKLTKEIFRLKDNTSGEEVDAKDVITDYWSGSANYDRIKHDSHWRGSERWYGVGEQHYKRLEHLYELSNSPKISSMIEWGPGGGVNAVRFLKEMDVFYGVDICQPNLDECNRQVIGHELKKFIPLLVDSDKPESVIDRISGDIDFFMSVAVFQHFPNQEYGEKIVTIASQLLKTGGIALIQIRYDDGSEKYVAKSQDYYQNVITFTSYTLDTFSIILERNGFEILEIIKKEENNYGFFYLRKIS
jgi:SAM-dependent methyltransferase